MNLQQLGDATTELDMPPSDDERVCRPIPARYRNARETAVPSMGNFDRRGSAAARQRSGAVTTNTEGVAGVASPSEHSTYRSLPTVLCVVCAESCGCRMRLIPDAVRTLKVVDGALISPSKSEPHLSARRHSTTTATPPTAKKRAEPITPRTARRLPFPRPPAIQFPLAPTFCPRVVLRGHVHSTARPAHPQAA